MPEGAEIILTEHALDGLKDECDFVTAAAGLLFSDLFCFFGFTNAGHR